MANNGNPFEYIWNGQFWEDTKGLVGLEGVDVVPDSVEEMIDDKSTSGHAWAIGKDSTLGQERYDFKQRVFPPDIGSQGSFNGHYVVFNINVQTSWNPLTGGAIPYQTISRNRNGQSEGQRTIFTPLGELSKTDALRYTIDNTFGNQSSTELGSSFDTRPRFTKRIAESIALYFPNAQLDWSDVHSYDGLSLTSFGSDLLGIGKQGLSRMRQSGMSRSERRDYNAGRGGLFGFIYDAAGAVIGSGAKILGAPINPKSEVLFASTAQRQFRFDFLFAPETEEESKIVKEIIKTFRFHAAPEVRPNFGTSLTFRAPSEFDITFYHKDKENTNIPRINTCVMTRSEVNYGPGDGAAFFSNGHPVSVRLMMEFHEVEITHKLRVAQGF